MKPETPRIIQQGYIIELADGGPWLKDDIREAVKENPALRSPTFYRVKAEACGFDRLSCAEHLRFLADVIAMQDTLSWSSSDVNGSASADKI